MTDVQPIPARKQSQRFWPGAAFPSLLLFITVLFAGNLAAQNLPPPPGAGGAATTDGRRAERRLLVRLKPGQAIEPLASAVQARSIRSLPRFRAEILELDDSRSRKLALAACRQNPAVEHVEEDALLRLDWPAAPNDPEFQAQKLWGLHNEGTGPFPFSVFPYTPDINAPAAWQLQTSAANVVVAIIDTGIYLQHPDLDGNLWTNPGETPNGLDDDANGYIDDMHGVDVANGDGVPEDNLGHGTMVAGIIGAEGNNGREVAGVAWQVKLMACKASESQGLAISAILECLDYALSKGASIINMSFGSAFPSQFLADGIAAARNVGVIVVAAAGNGSRDADQWGHYPSGLDLDNIVSVGSVSPNQQMSGFSNLGDLTVDLFAPGESIVSTWTNPSQLISTNSGTSFAAPYVAGSAALLKARFPADTYLQTINRLLKTTTANSNYRCLTQGRLNLDAAIRSTSGAPRNDNFGSSAQKLPPGGTVNGLTYSLLDAFGAPITIVANNSHATKQTGEPNHAGNSGGHSLWWFINGNIADGYDRITVTTEGSEVDTLLAVYTGGTVGGLTVVASDDNGAGNGASRVSFKREDTQYYWIAVDGKNGAVGTIRLRVAPSPHRYLVTDLGTTPIVNAVTDTKARAGAQLVGGVHRAVKWINGSPTDLGVLAGDVSSVAYAMSPSGVAVGASLNASSVPHAFLHNGSLVSLGTLGGNASEARSINGRGEIAGSAKNSSQFWRAFHRSIDGSMTALPTLGGSSGYGMALNDAQEVVGYSAINGGGTLHAFKWANNQITDLGTLGGAQSKAMAINQYGDITGMAQNAGGVERAVLWQNGVVKDLGCLGGNAIGKAVNNFGAVVGQSARPSGSPHALLWENGMLYDLNSVNLVPDGAVWDFLDAVSINHSGEIVGTALKNGTPTSFLLTPVDRGFDPASLVKAANGFSFQLRGYPGEVLKVAFSESVTSPAGDPESIWTFLSDYTIQANGSVGVSDSLPPGTKRRFYLIYRFFEEPSFPSPGFMEVDFTAGLSMVANHFRTVDNRVASLFGNPPDGIFVHKWNATTDQYEVSGEFDDPPGVSTWDLPKLRLDPGEGLVVDAYSSFSVVFKGEVRDSTFYTRIPSGLSIVGAKAPQTWPVTGTTLGYVNDNHHNLPVIEGLVLHKLQAGGQWLFDTYAVTNGDWMPDTPELRQGEAVWLDAPAEDEWFRYFEMIHPGQTFLP